MLRTVGRCGGLMSSAVDSGSSSPGAIPGRTKCDVYLGRHLTFKVPLSAQMGTGEFNAGGNPVMDLLSNQVE